MWACRPRVATLSPLQPGCPMRLRRHGPRLAATLAIILPVVAAAVSAVRAQDSKIPNGVAVLAALDKVTGRVSPLEVPIDETATFGGLKVTPRVCYTRPPTEPPLTSAFLEVDEVVLDGSVKRIFTGWMFAQSPGLHSVEHPTFDVWLTNCKMPLEGRSGGRRPNSARP
jgi:hypothetical protein